MDPTTGVLLSTTNATASRFLGGSLRSWMSGASAATPYHASPRPVNPKKNNLPNTPAGECAEEADFNLAQLPSPRSPPHEDFPPQSLAGPLNLPPSSPAHMPHPESLNHSRSSSVAISHTPELCSLPTPREIHQPSPAPPNESEQLATANNRFSPGATTSNTEQNGIIIPCEQPISLSIPEEICTASNVVDQGVASSEQPANPPHTNLGAAKDLPCHAETHSNKRVRTGENTWSNAASPSLSAHSPRDTALPAQNYNPPLNNNGSGLPVQIDPSFTALCFVRPGINTNLAFIQSCTTPREAFRVTSLWNACQHEDFFFLVLHQTFCIHTVHPRILDAVPGLGSQQVESLMAIRDILFPSSIYTKNFFQLCCQIPADFVGLVRSNKPYMRAMNFVMNCLPLLARRWPGFVNVVLERKYPPLVQELANSLGVPSPSFQQILFVRCRDLLARGRHVVKLNEIYKQDRNLHHERTIKLQKGIPVSDEQIRQENTYIVKQYQMICALFADLNVCGPASPMPITPATPTTPITPSMNLQTTMYSTRRQPVPTVPSQASQQHRAPQLALTEEACIQEAWIQAQYANLAQQAHQAREARQSQNSQRARTEYVLQAHQVHQAQHAQQAQQAQHAQRTQHVQQVHVQYANQAQQVQQVQQAQQPQDSRYAQYAQQAQAQQAQQVPHNQPIQDSRYDQYAQYVQQTQPQHVPMQHTVAYPQHTPSGTCQTVPGWASQQPVCQLQPAPQPRTSQPQLQAASNGTSRHNPGIAVPPNPQYLPPTASQQRRTSQHRYPVIGGFHRNVSTAVPSATLPTAGLTQSSVNLHAGTSTAHSTFPILTSSAAPISAPATPTSIYPSSVATRQLAGTALLPQPGAGTFELAQPNPHVVGLHQLRLRVGSRGLIETPDNSAPRLLIYLQSFAIPPFCPGAKEVNISYDLKLTPKESKKLPVQLPSNAATFPVLGHVSGTRSYQLKCVKSESGSDGLAEEKWATMDCIWPNAIYIYVNDSEHLVRRKFHNGRDLPLNITGSLKEGSNKISITILRRPDEPAGFYALAVELLETMDYDQVRDSIGALSKSDSIDRITGKLRAPDVNDDEIAIVDDYMTIDLIDPFMARIFKTPVRGKLCTHWECFDLETFLTTRMASSSKESLAADSWKCPVCRKDARPKSLLIDEFLVGIRAQLEQNKQLDVARAVMVKKDGSWSIKIDQRMASEQRENIHKEQTPSDKMETSDLRDPHSDLTMRRPAPEVIEID